MKNLTKLLLLLAIPMSLVAQTTDQCVCTGTTPCTETFVTHTRHTAKKNTARVQQRVTPSRPVIHTRRSVSTLRPSRVCNCELEQFPVSPIQTYSEMPMRVSLDSVSMFENLLHETTSVVKKKSVWPWLIAGAGVGVVMATLHHDAPPLIVPPISPVPEPSTILLTFLGVFAIFMFKVNNKQDT